MSTLDELERVERAEDYFELLEVPFDGAVLHASRVHLLRVFGFAIAEIDARTPPPDEPERLRLYRDALRRAHALVAHDGAHRAGAGSASRCGGCGAVEECAS
jgi:hypothetical protein